MIITIDGPASSGKSTVAALVAERRVYFYYSSGLLYRACAYILTHHAGYSAHTLEGNLRPEDIANYCNKYRVIYHYDLHKGPHILFDNVDITRHLKQPVISDYAAIIGANEQIRIEIKAMQKAITEKHANLVAEGRDMGSDGFPHADYKFFLTASLDVRAKRWVMSEEKKGINLPLEEARARILDRDQRDTIRFHAPLVVPVDAITIDSTDMTIEETVQTILQAIQTKRI